MDYSTVTIRIKKHNPANGLQLDWEKDFYIKITEDDGSMLLQANASGLRSLAKHFLSLANSEVPLHSHVHLDESNSLENGSAELIIEKIAD